EAAGGPAGAQAPAAPAPAGRRPASAVPAASPRPAEAARRRDRTAGRRSRVLIRRGPETPRPTRPELQADAAEAVRAEEIGAARAYGVRHRLITSSGVTSACLTPCNEYCA